MRYHAYKLPGLEPLHSAVPLREVSLYRAKNEPGELTAVIDKGTAFQRMVVESTGERVPLLSDHGTLIVADDGRTARAFIVELVTEDADGQDRVRFSAVGFGNMVSDQPWDPAAGAVRDALSNVPGFRPRTGEVAGVEVDPLDMVRAMWHLVTAYEDTPDVAVDSTRSPVRIGEEEEEVEFETSDGQNVSFEAGPYRLSWHGTDDLKKEIDDLAVETPFEWREETAFNRMDASPPGLRIRLGYPRFESVRRDNLHFGIDTNVFDPQLRDDEDFFSEVLVVGNGEGAAKIRGHARRTGHGRMRRVKVISDQGVRSNKLANQVARDACDQADRDDRFIEACTVKDHPAARIGTFDVGDIITVKGRMVWGWHEQDCRVVSLDHDVAAHQARITLERLPE